MLSETVPETQMNVITNTQTTTPVMSVSDIVTLGFECCL